MTFLRFFEVFAGASEPVAVGLVFEGEALFGAFGSEATLALLASPCSVMATGEDPLDRRAASVIQCGKWVGRSRMLFLEMRGLDWCHYRDLVTHCSIARSSEGRQAPEAATFVARTSLSWRKTRGGGV